MLRSSFVTSALLLAWISLPFPQVADCKKSDYLFPAVQVHPTVERPFVFLHQRKCGGMSVRVAAYMSGLKMGLEAASFVPCFNPMCKTQQPDLASIQASAILACHCNWYTVIPRVKNLRASALSATQSAELCLVSFFFSHVKCAQRCWQT